ncbi:MAG: hypothetical protein GX124_06445 [Clostridiales bacterium]|nr:hypothetical protein [Clostridiales bacterium]
MPRRTRAWLLALFAALFVLPAAGGQVRPRFVGLYWPAFQEDVFELSPGGGFGDYTALAARGNLLAFIRREAPDRPDSSLSLYDLSSARALASIPLEATGWVDSWQLGFWAPGQPYTLNEETLGLTAYDQDLKEILRFSPPDGFDLAAPDPIGQALWCAGFEGSGLTRFDLVTGESASYPAGLPAGWYFSRFLGASPQGGVLSLFSNNSGNQAFFSVEPSGGARLMPVMAGFTAANGGLAYATHAGDGLLMPTPGEGRVLRLSSWREDEYVAGFSQGFLITQAWGEGPALRLIDLDQGEVSAQLQMPPGDTPPAFDLVALSDQGYAVLSDNQYELNRFGLYLWDYSLSPASQPAGIRETTLPALREENDALASAIGEKHGIQIHIRQAGARFVNDTYYGNVLDEEPALTRALLNMQGQLDRFPPGMLQEALVPYYDRFAIYFSGPIGTRGEEGIMAPAGFASAYGGERYIAVSSARSLAHELMHLFEDHLAEPQEAGGRDLLADWLLLCPPEAENAGFYYDYHDENGWELSDTRYTLDDPDAWENPGNAWFIDAYSRTFPLEDRARIFETLFLAGEDAPDLLSSPHLLRKAQYLCAILRERYESLRDAPPLYWERHITPIPYADFVSEFEALDIPLIPIGRLAPVPALC